MAQLIILGSLYVALSTAGNSIHLQHDFSSFIGVILGIVTITISCILSYIFDVKFFLINTNKNPAYEYQLTYAFALALGCFLLLFQIKALLYVLIPRSTWKKLPFATFWLTCEMAKSECCTKQAAAYKIKKMVEHAISHHDGSSLADAKSASLKMQRSTFTSSHAKAIMCFQATADHREQVGGIRYTFRKMWDGSLFKEEGVYIHSRLYAMNVSQWFIVIFYIVLFAGLDTLIQVTFNPEPEAPSMSPSPTRSPAPSISAEQLTAELVASSLPLLTDSVTSMLYLGDDLLSALWKNFSESNIDLATTFAAKLLNFSSSEIIQSIAYLQGEDTLAIFQTVADWKEQLANTTRHLMETTTPQYRHLQEETSDGLDWLPTESEVRFASSVGCTFALIAAISLAIVWIPSSVSSILQFRCGYIGSLRDRSFADYRLAPDLTTILFGSAFWGTFYSSASILVFVGSLAFLLIWSATRSVVLIILANVIGIMVTLTFKILLLLFFRKMLFEGFFRTRPSGSNVLFLVLGTLLPFHVDVLPKNL